MRKSLIFIILLSTCASWAQTTDLLIARNTGKYPIWTGDTLRVFGFTQSLGAEVKIPGPTLIYNEGDSVIIDLWNVSQGAPHTIHLHGLDVDQANDGVPHLSFEVGHMAHGFYHFKAPHAGTYLYHCHVVSTIHVQAGMYGLIIIRPPNGGFTTWAGGHAYDKEMSWMTSELDSNWHKDDVLDHPHDTSGAIIKIEIPEFYPQYFLVNGLSEYQLNQTSVALQSAVGEKLYLRLANIGYYGNTFHFPAAYNARIISSDGRPLPTEELSDSLTIFPGERYGVLLEATAQFTDSISISYFNLNTNNTESTQWVSAKTSGFVSLKELAKNELKIYPNPNSGEVWFELKNYKPIKWEITDALGRQLELEVSKVSDFKYKAQISQLPKGWYVVKVYHEKGILSSVLIKE